MRVALCFSGQARTFEKCFKSQRKYILDPLKPDIFIHTWTFPGHNSLHSTHNDGYSVQKYIDYIKSNKNITNVSGLISLYNPKYILIENPDAHFFIEKIKQSQRFNHKDKTKDTFNKLFDNNNKYKWFNLIMMYYSVFMSNKLKKDYEDRYNIKYDLVIRSRMDLYFEDFKIDATIEDVSNNIIFLPPNQDIDIIFNPEMLRQLKKRGPAFMPNDKLAYGNSESMDYYSSIYSFFDKDIDYYPHHGEATITNHLWTKNNSIYKNIKINDNIKMKIEKR